MVKRERSQALEKAEKAESVLKKTNVKLEKAKDRAAGLEAENADLKAKLAGKEKESADFQLRAKTAEQKAAEQAKLLEDATRQLEELRASQTPAAGPTELNDEMARAIIESWKASSEYTAELKAIEEKTAQDCLREWSEGGFLDQEGLQKAYAEAQQEAQEVEGDEEGPEE